MSAQPATPEPPMKPGAPFMAAQRTWVGSTLPVGRSEGEAATTESLLSPPQPGKISTENPVKPPKITTHTIQTT